MDSTPVPVYTATADPADNIPPPAYVFPTSFKIGHQQTNGALVQLQHVKAHLALLHAFAQLRQRVEKMDDAQISVWANGMPVPAEKDRRWGIFVGFAADRFERWVKADGIRYTIENPHILPPIDVIMVWHAYLLNPSWYAEDCVRLPRMRYLKNSRNAFVTYVLDRITEVVGDIDPDLENARINRWVETTRTSFDPFPPFDSPSKAFDNEVFFAVPSGRDVSCPACGAVTVASYLTVEGTGYLQEGFKLACSASSDHPLITKETLAVYKLADNIVRDDHSAYSYLAGTIYTPLALDKDRARHIKDTISETSIIKRPKKTDKFPVNDHEWRKYLVTEVAEYDLDKFQKYLALTRPMAMSRSRGKLMRAYTDDREFSIDLVGAVLRQGSFVTKMYNLNWTQPDFFAREDDEIALQHAVARYHAFLDLLSSSPVSFFVPTLDIDLVWHTHQLMSDSYAEDTLKYIKRFVDHDDKVEENTLASAFDLTCRAWEERFKIRYSHCGCPMPGERIGQRLSRFMASQPTTPSHLQPPERDELLAATHPSDHNAVFNTGRHAESEAARQTRLAKIQSRRARDEEKVRKGKMSQKDARRGEAHEAAFLYPVPLYGYAGPVGCAAFAGGVHMGAGGCAVGAGGCAGGGGGCGGGGGGGGCGGGGGGGGGGCGGGGGGGCGGGGS